MPNYINQKEETDVIGLVAPWIARPLKRITGKAPIWILNLESLAFLYGICGSDTFEIFEEYYKAEQDYKRKKSKLFWRLLAKLKLVTLKEPNLDDYIRKSKFYQYTKLWLIRASIEILEYSSSLKVAVNKLKSLIFYVENLIWGDADGMEKTIAVRFLNNFFSKQKMENFLQLVESQNFEKLSSLLEVDKKAIEEVYKYYK